MFHGAKAMPEPTIEDLIKQTVADKHDLGLHAVVTRLSPMHVEVEGFRLMVDAKAAINGLSTKTLIPHPTSQL